MNRAKKIIKWCLISIFLSPIAYLIVAIICTYIPINGNSSKDARSHILYLHTNGVHIDIAIPKDEMDSTLLAGLSHDINTRYFSFGWGDRDFYLNTPTWGDLTFKNAMTGMFLRTSSLMHVSNYKRPGNDWTEVFVSNDQLEKMQVYLQQTFQLDSTNNKIILVGQGYSTNDNFYEAQGHFTALRTCNSWANIGLKESEMDACLWTPFDFGILRLYEEE